MVVGWAPWWTGQTERTSLLTVGADRIYQKRHHDWIEAFLVSHGEVRLADQHREVRSVE
jgi:hypothetical protein